MNLTRFPVVTQLARYGLWLPGLIMLAVYVAFVWMYAEGPHTHSRLLRELFIWPACLTLMASYGWATWLVGGIRQPTQRHWAWVIGLALAMGLVCWLLPPFHSTDVFGYINRGWQQLAYGSNPYVTTVGQLPSWQSDAMITDHWVNNPCPYGFLFAHLIRWWVLPFQGDLSATLGLVKALNLFWLWVVTALVGFSALQWHKRVVPTTENIYANNHIALRRVVLLAWHPLILLHHVANGHNDIWMGGLLAAAMAVSLLPAKSTLASYFKWTETTTIWVASVLIKYATAVVGPFIVWGWVLQRQWGRLILCSMTVILVVGVLGWPYWLQLSDFQTTALAENASLPHSSLHALLVFSVNIVLKLLNISKSLLPSWITFSRWLLLAGFAVILAGLFWRMWQQRKIFREHSTIVMQQSWQSGLVALCVFVGLISSKFYPWYVGMVLPAVLILPGQRGLFQVVWLVSVMQVLGITVLGQARMADVIVMTLLPLSIWVWWRYGKGHGRLTEWLQGVVPHHLDRRA